MPQCGREAPGSGPCILEATPGDPFGHWGGCSWESEDAWQPIHNDVCPGCGERGFLEVRQLIPAGSGAGAPPRMQTEYRCHGCGANGPARPAQ